jgi:hypothetical protein
MPLSPLPSLRHVCTAPGLRVTCRPLAWPASRVGVTGSGLTKGVPAQRRAVRGLTLLGPFDSRGAVSIWSRLPCSAHRHSSARAGLRGAASATSTSVAPPPRASKPQSLGRCIGAAHPGAPACAPAPCNKTHPGRSLRDLRPEAPPDLTPSSIRAPTRCFAMGALGTRQTAHCSRNGVREVAPCFAGIVWPR